MIELPGQFAQRMQRMLGEEYDAFLASYERERRPSLRVNTLKAADETRVCNDVDLVKTRSTAIADTGDSEESEMAFAAAAPWELTRVPWAAGGYSYAGTDRPGKHAFHEAGVYYIQEASAMAVAALSGAQPGERILDLCAAPGGKSTQLAAMLQGRGLLVSNEIGSARARILSQNIERMGIPNALVTNETPDRLAERFAGFYDRVIVDAPCSGEGMFRSKDEALPLWSQAHVDQCAARQQDILDAAARMVRPGGILMYSTCTFAPEEDEESVAAFLATHPDYALVGLPEQLGGSMEEWGFDRGNPAWCRSEIPYPLPGDLPANDPYVSGRVGTSIAIPEEIRGQLSRTIRLFPHRMGGEGHFLAMLRRAGIRAQAETACRAEEDSRKEIYSSPEERGRHKEISGGSEECGSGKGMRDGRDRGSSRKERGGKNARGSKAAGRDRNRDGRGTDDARRLWREFAAENLTCDPAAVWAADAGSVFLTFGEELYLEPAGIPIAGLRVLRPGLHLGSVRKDRFEPAQALAEALRPEDAIRVWNIEDGDAEDARDAAAYLRGESLPCDPALKGWTLVTVSDRGGHRYSLGWAKASGGMLKNHYPKGLRRPY